MRILIINDDAGESDYLARVATRRGCDVVALSSMHDALPVLDDVDLALLSTESSTADVVKAVETIRAESDLPLIVMASRICSDKCAEALLAGADDYVARLVNVDELMVRIRALLRRHRPPARCPGGSSSTTSKPI